MFAASATKTAPDKLKQAFTGLLAFHLSLPRGQVRRAAEYLFSALTAATTTALSVAAARGLSTAQEALAASRHGALLDELNALAHNIDLMSGRRIDTSRIKEFEQQYARQVAQRHRFIIPPHFDTTRRVPIDDLYVVPNLAQIATDPAHRPPDLTPQSLITRLGRAVLLGNPGAGKSTMALKLVHDLALRQSDGDPLTPALVILRDYGAVRKTHGASIVDFLHQTAATNYQLTAPPRAFEFLFLNGHALVVFDGLDELLDTAYRREITADVEAFCALFPTTPILVTSREVGYDEAPLDDKLFARYRLADFTESQVTSYSHKWFSLDEDVPATVRTKHAASFIRESGLVPDLRGNALMLGLMCNIYRGENYLPRNRPDVYQKCALMLFERSGP